MSDETLTWAYTRRGRVAHALPKSTAIVAVCSVAPPWPENWFGTGDQREHEKAARLPRCATCLRLLRQQGRPWTA